MKIKEFTLRILTLLLTFHYLLSYFIISQVKNSATSAFISMSYIELFPITRVPFFVFLATSHTHLFKNTHI